MGEAKRRQEAEAAGVESTRKVVWMSCPTCGRSWPWPAQASRVQAPLELYPVCCVCLFADLSRVMREAPERFRFLATNRATLGLPLVVEESSDLKKVTQ